MSNVVVVAVMAFWLVVVIIIAPVVLLIPAAIVLVFAVYGIAGDAMANRPAAHVRRARRAANRRAREHRHRR